MTELDKLPPYFYSFSPEDKQAFNIVRKLFKNDYGEPFEMTPGQIELFRTIYEKRYPRVQFDCYTQYGKSDVVSMAVLLRVSTFIEKWIILGATKDKAAIIMSKLIKHIFDNDYTLGKFQIDENESLDFIRRNRAKDNITFKVDETGIGQVITLSADARRKSQDAGDILVGHGGQNLIEDDAALIPDPIHGKALRMLGGHATHDSFLLKITNSFGRNHAYRSAVDSDNQYGTGQLPPEKMNPQNPLFHRIVINYQQGLDEGRLTQEFVTEMRNALDPIMFGILYDCVYPPSDMVEDGGWMLLVTPEMVEEAQGRNNQSIGKKRMGVDVAEGTNLNAFVIRTDNVAYVKETNLEKDPMKTADRTTVLMGEERVAPQEVTIDTSGGSGIYSRIRQMGLEVNSFKGGESPTEKTPAQKILDPMEFFNLRAECFWAFRQWILQGGALAPHPGWKQLSVIRYKVASDKKIQIMSKEEMRARGYLQASESTDIPDAASMTFVPHIVKYSSNAVATSPVKPYYPDIDGGSILVMNESNQAQQSQGGFNTDLR